jgi:diguanylate cyclase (GGDEF)-like protein
MSFKSGGPGEEFKGARSVTALSKKSLHFGMLINRAVALAAVATFAVSAVTFIEDWQLWRGHDLPNDAHLVTSGILAGSATLIAFTLWLVVWGMNRHHRRLDQHHQAEHEKLIYLDGLTGCASRAGIQRALERVVQDNPDNPRHYVIYQIDYDRFRLVNETLGHEQGDSLIRQMAERLLAICDSFNENDSIRACAIVGRIAGDEFLLFTEGPDAVDQLQPLCDRLLSDLARPYDLPHRRTNGSVSIGITTSANRYAAAEHILRDAGIALDEAKKQGGNQARLFDKPMHDQLCDRLALEHDLADALENNELYLVLQPIIQLTTHQPVGFEALIRWRHPQRGLVRPDQFISIAEDSGLIVPIGRWVLRESCRQLAELRRRVPGSARVTINVNVSRQQLTDPSLLEDVRQTIEQFGLRPEDLHLEITESTIMDNAEIALRTLHELKQLGVLIAMDDFGTGMSSLSCLHEFPIDVLKIDRKFIMHLAERSDYMAVVQAIVVLAHNVGAMVVAEGLETTEQVATLLALESDLGQGYFFAKPLSFDDAIDYLNGKTQISAAAG